MITCKVCEKEFENVAGLHLHIKKTHNFFQSDYYHLYYPRYDMLSGELIHFKNKDQYFETDFNSRENFAKWAAANRSSDKTKQYCLDLLKKRKEKKGLIYLPSHAELKSIMLPNIYGFITLCGGLNKFNEEIEKIGVKQRFNYSEEPEFKRGKLEIFIDSREQQRLDFSVPVKDMKLSVGDYGCGPNFFSDVFVERKSIQDLAGTLSAGFERFEREVQRADMLGSYLVVVAEGSFSDVLSYSPSNSFAKKMTGSHIFYQMRQIMNKFTNIQFVFAGNRKRAADMIEKIFRLKDQVKHLDLEFLNDGGKI